MDHILIRGARQHNLKNIDLSLPRNRFIVITGVSGSGKSSLAFDTLYAEGRRRYIVALSSYARQFLERLDAPKVDEITGLSPAIAIEQKGSSRNPRSTVGTLTEIHDHLRILFARLGTVYCPSCNIPVRAWTISGMIEEIMGEWPEGARLLVLAPLGQVAEKDLPSLVKRLRRDGYARIRLDGKIYELEPLPAFPRRKEYSPEVVVDRLVLSSGKSQRLRDSFELASKIGHGVVAAVRTDGGEKRFCEDFRCLSCGRTLSRPEPSLFSFFHPAGACPVCRGLGTVEMEEPSKSGGREGVEGGESSDELENPRIFEPATCPGCHGTRLNETARSVKLGGLGIDQVSGLDTSSLRQWILELALSESEKLIAERPFQEISSRLSTMEELGLGYLSLDRSAVTLSGGEAQRIRLAHQIGAELSGVLYILDEPSIGLHPRDHGRLLEILFRLRDRGNTVIVVEHDRQTILEADYVVDMGPGAGALGGEVLFAGIPADIASSKKSLTGMYLSGKKTIPVPTRRRALSRGEIRLIGARGHNLKNLTVSFPLGCITCVTGVSGSGKSSLVLHTLYRAMAGNLTGAGASSLSLDAIEGAESIGKVVLIDQSPLGRTPRSNPATYTGLFSLIRRLFSQLPESRARGYGANRFSFNVKGGRCEACKGEGLQRIEMVFLPDVYVMCPVCKGSRYGAETLEIRFKGLSIAEVLDLTIEDALRFFENVPSIRQKLAVLEEVGLGYLRLGQAATTLSGGEAQRVKLGAELARKTGAKTLYILDEPTTGLHFDDIEKLLHVLHRLADQGHTLILIEHHPDVIKTADYVIDLGPEGGEKGGYLLGAGTPEEVARLGASSTGMYLRQAIEA